jgi:transglutaminase-like putative cysteine protease
MTSGTVYRVRHETLYKYSAEVVHAHHLLHLVPRAMAHQACSEQSIQISPEPTEKLDAVDAFGNPLQRLEFNRPHQQLCVVSEMKVEVRERHIDATRNEGVSESWERARNRLLYAGRPPGDDHLEALRYRVESPYIRIKQVFTEYASDCFPAGRPLLEAAHALMMKLHREMKYTPGVTDISTPLLQVLKDKRGVCQDYAHLMIACLRARGLAARYVSGYLRTTPRPGMTPAAAQLVGADASHAWVSVFCPPIGWVEFDPTNGVRAGLDHIAIAWGRDFGDVSPLRGVILGGGSHTLTVRVSVELVGET